MRRIILILALISITLPTAAFAAGVIDDISGGAPQGGVASDIGGTGTAASAAGNNCATAGVPIGAGIAAVQKVLGVAGGAASALGGAGSALGGVAGTVDALSGVAGGGSEVPVHDKANLEQNTVTANSERTLVTKECVLDGLVVQIREALIASITQSIINWINNGFEGGPLFVTNLTGFLGQVADQVSLNFINGGELNSLCSPFQAPIKIALTRASGQSFTQRVQCSLGNVSNNAQQFLNGDFSQGGFTALFRLATDVQNNPYGAYLLAEDEQHSEIAAALDTEKTQFVANQGFISSGTCDGADQTTNPDGTAASTPGDQWTCDAAHGHWNIATPGSMIASNANFNTQSGQRQLELADEINEIISALMSQLAQKALTSLQGFRGLSSRTSSTANAQGSYLDQLTQTSQTNAVSSSQNVLILNLTSSISLEQSYQRTLSDLNAVLGSEKSIQTTRYQCYINTGNATKAQTATSTAATAAAQISANNTTLTRSVAVVAALTDIVATASAATTATALNAAGARYDAVSQSGELTSSGSLMALQSTFAAEQDTLNGMKAESGDQCLPGT